MRLLGSFVGGHGHFLPLVPLARAARDAGHSVTFTCGRFMVDAVERAGFEALPTTPPPVGADAAPDEPPTPQPLLPVDAEREERDLREKFARDGARARAPGILGHLADWGADVLLCDEVDFGAVIAAERAGIPAATVVVLAAGGMLRPELLAEPLDEVRREHGLSPDPDLRAMRGSLVLSPVPPAFRDPADPLPPGTRGVRLHAPLPVVPPRPWTAVRPDLPAVYVTLGTVFNLESGDLLERVVAGLALRPGDAVVTIGNDRDPVELGPLPPNVHVRRFVAQEHVLPHVGAVVSHGGSGSVLGALAHGRPMVLLAMGADQPRNADRCVALGVGRSLDPVSATPGDIAAAIDAVLADPAARAAAGSLARTMADLPAPATAVRWLETLAARRALA